jgi:carboxypeptidase C (cathepsin A)
VLKRSTVFTFLAMLAVSAAFAQPPRPVRDVPGAVPPSMIQQAPARPDAARTEVPEVYADRISTTSHVARIDGQEVRYTANAGTIVLRDEKGKAKANLFFIAYTRDGAGDARSRPLTFSYNGGPGAASIWLHMGTLGPRRVVMAGDGFMPAPPFEFADNDQSLLDVTDLVMIDPVGTGFSRPAADEDGRQFWGLQQDAEWLGQFVRLYLTRYNRWASPKFLLGESYGTIRSAALSGELQQRHGIELNGIVLVSSVLDFQTLLFGPTNELPHVVFLPTYTATAWYHKKLPADLQGGSLESAIEEARGFAFGEYATALMKGNRLSQQEWKTTAQKVARLTGLSPAFVEQANLRIEAGRFRKELLRDRRLVTGRLDSRFTAIDADAAGERQEFDPANTALQGAYTAIFNDYVRRELKYESDIQYMTSGNVRPWEYPQNQYAQAVSTLRFTMARNPFLRVLVTNGYYDMATPFAGTEYTFAHLGYEPTYQQRVEMTYYEAGHMMYIRPSDLRKFKVDVAGFIRSALRPGPATSTSPPAAGGAGR